MKGKRKMKELKRVFNEICEMQEIYRREVLSEKKEIAKMSLGNGKILQIIYEETGEGIVSQYTLKGKKSGVEHFWGTGEYLSVWLFVNDVFREARQIDSVEKLNKRIREYTDPVDVMEILNTFITLHQFTPEKENFFQKSVLYRFPNMAVVVRENALGTKYLLAYPDTEEKGVIFDSVQYIQSTKELNKFYKECCRKN